jgi:hypothetical protein
MIETVLLLTLMQIYSEVFPEWGLSIFPPNINNYTDYSKYKSNCYTRLFTQLLIWIGYSMVFFQSNRIATFCMWINVGIAMCYDIGGNYTVAYVNYMIAMGIVSIMLMSQLDVRDAFNIVSYFSWYLSGGMQLVINRQLDNNEIMSKFLLCLANLCMTSATVGTHSLLQGKSYISRTNKIVYITTWLIIFGKYFIELGIW